MTGLCGAAGGVIVLGEADAFGEFDDGCLDFAMKSRLAAIRSVSDRPVTLLLPGVLGVAARGVARLVGFSPPMRLPILPVSAGAGAAGAVDLENVLGESESARGEPMRSPMLCRLEGLDRMLRSPDGELLGAGALMEGDEGLVEIDPLAPGE